MASGVRLCVALVICAGYTCPNFQNINAESDLKTFFNKTEINDIRLESDNQNEKASTNKSSQPLKRENKTLENVPNKFQREDKGLRPQNHEIHFAMEADALLKGEPSRDRYFNIDGTPEDDVEKTSEIIDPVYKLNEALKTSGDKFIRNEVDQDDGNKNSSVKYGIVANVASRIKRSTELVSFSDTSSATEVSNLLQSSSGNKGDLDVAAGHHSHKWSKGGGHKHKKEHHSKGGHKKDKGYKTKHHHKKGEHEKHGKNEHKKHYKKHSGHKKKHHDQAEKYGEHHKKEKGHKGAKYGEKKGHKKGHKTKGYHHKFHKDEYKKEHKFYDDYHKKGHHDKHGHHHKHHAKKAGKHKKGGHHKSAYHKDQYGKKGHKEGGHYDQEHKGHKGKKGHKKYHENHSDYGKKGGHKEGKKWGYSKKHKHG